MYKISGTYCASLTPFNADYSINKKLLLEHCNNLLSQNIDGIAIFYWQTKQIFKGIPQIALISQKRGVDYWNGKSAPNSGGLIINGSMGLMWSLGQQHFTLSVKVPLYQALNMVNEASSVDNHADMWGFSVSYRTILTLGDK